MPSRDNHPFFKPYLWLISLLGIVLLGTSILSLRPFPLHPNWLLFIGLTVVSAWFTVTVPLNGTSTTYHIGATPAIAAVALFGFAESIFLAALFVIILWISKPSEEFIWRKNWSQLSFNVGNQVLSTVFAAVVIVACQTLFMDITWLRLTFPWLAGAVVYDLSNKLVFVVILALQSDFDQSLRDLWREEGWSSQLLILIYALGSGLLFFSADQFNFAGIIIFYLPILASIYAFKLYVQKVQLNFNQLEEIVRERTADLENINRQKDLFLTFLTHDLMTPISSIRFSGEQIKTDQSLSEVGKAHAEIILRSQRSLANMVSNILDIEKLEVGQSLTASPELVLLQDLVETAIGIIQSEAIDKELKIDVSMEPNPIVVFADYLQLERVMFNLLSNALKYTAMGGTISVNIVRDSALAIISVADTGYGIPLEYQDKVFDKYVQLKSLEGKSVGTGLGLAIAKELIEGCDGTISLSSCPGEGSTFTIKLPIREGHDERIFE